MPAANPFLDAVPSLYATADRLARRTDALHRAKISGRHAADVIADLAPRNASVVADIGFVDELAGAAAPAPRWATTIREAPVGAAGCREAWAWDRPRKPYRRSPYVVRNSDGIGYVAVAGLGPTELLTRQTSEISTSSTGYGCIGNVGWRHCRGSTGYGG